MQILLKVVPSFANYKVWWPYKIDISFCKKLYMNSSFVTTFFFFFLPKQPLQQNVVSVTNFSEENFFLTKKYYIATKYIFRRYL